MDHVSLSVFDQTGKKLCDLYDSDVKSPGQAYNIQRVRELSGWKEVSFELPYMIDKEENWRWKYIQSEYSIRVMVGEKKDWFTITSPKKGKNSRKISGTITCGHCSGALKTKNLYLAFDDENGIGTLPYLMKQVLAGTGWSFDEDGSDVFYETHAVDSNEELVEKKRSLKSDGKEGAFALIGSICDLFHAYPVFDGDEKTVTCHDLNNKEPLWEMEIGRNLTALTKEADSSSIVTRLYVEGDYDEDEYVGIDDVNPTGLPFLVNFDYYKSIGLFTDEHQEALDSYLQKVSAIRQSTTGTAKEVAEKSSRLSILWGDIGYVLWTVKNGSMDGMFVGGEMEEKQQKLLCGDQVYVFTSDGKYTTTTIDAGWTGAFATNVTHVLKFDGKCNGSIGAKEVAIEAKEQTIADLQADNEKETTTDEKKAENLKNIESIRKTIQQVYSGSGEAEEHAYTVRVTDAVTLRNGESVEAEIKRTSTSLILNDATYHLSTSTVPFVTDNSVKSLAAGTSLVIGPYGQTGDLGAGVVSSGTVLNVTDDILNLSSVPRVISVNCVSGSSGEAVSLPGTTFTMTVSAVAYGLYEQFNMAIQLAEQIGRLSLLQKDQLSQQNDVEADFVIAMGDMLRDGYWNDDNYVKGQETYLYYDALDVLDVISKPTVKYAVTLLAYSDAMGYLPGEVKLNSQSRIYDAELEINDTVYVSKISDYLDREDQGSVEITNEEVKIGASFDSIFSRIASIANLIEQKKTIFGRADAINQNGTMATERLNGAIDILTTRLLSAVSNWYSDDRGNLIFEDYDGKSAMQLCGSGFMIANGKKKDGTWNWRTFGTGEGFTADAIITGFLSAERIEAGSISADKIAAGAITTEKLKAGAVTADKIVAGSVTSDKIAAKAITSDKIAAGAITADSGIISNSAIGTAQIADGSITDAKIVSLTANKLTAGTIDASKIAVNNLVADNITTGTINGKVIPVLGTEKIANGAITGIKIADDSVGSSKLSDGSVTSGKIANGAVVTDKIVSGAVTTDKLAANSVTANKIVSGAITTDKLAANSITSSKISASSITADKIATGAITAGCGIISDSAIETAQIADGSITDAKIVELTANKITSGTIDASKVIVNNIVADNITTGTINGKVIPVLGTDKVADGAITGGKIAKNAITADKIVSAAITTDKLAANSVIATKIASNAITTDKLNASAVTADKIAAGAITADKIAAGSITTSKISSDFGQSLDLSSNTSVSTKVSNTIDDLQIGGTNLILGSKNTVSIITPSTGDSGSAATIFEHGDDYPDKWCRLTAGSGSTTPRAIMRVYNVSVGRIYTFSADVIAYGGKARMTIYPLTSSGGLLGSSFYKDSVVYNNSVMRLSVTSESLPSGTASVYIIIDYYVGSGQSYFDTRKWKLEEGNKATTWTPALEDTESRLSYAETWIDQNNERVQISAKKIDELQIGGNNLLRGSRYPKYNLASESNFGVYYGTSNYIDGDFGVISFPAVDTKSWRSFATSIMPVEKIYGKTMTFSFEYQSDSYNDIRNATDGTPIYITFAACSSASNTRTKWRTIYSNSSESRSLFDSSSWKKFSYTFTVGSDDTWFVSGSGDVARCYIQYFNYSIYPVNIRKCKLEYGNMATDWSPSSDDVSVGGKNLLRGAGYLPDEYWSTDSSGATATGTAMRFINEDEDTGYYDVTNTNSNFRFMYKQYPAAASGTTFTISVKYRQISGTRTFMFQIEPMSSGAPVTSHAYLPEERALTGGWVLLYKTFTVAHSCSSIRVWLRSGEDYQLYTHEYYIKEPMLEYATTPSEWSRATEDPTYRLKNTVVTIDANGMDVATGGTINFHTSNFNVTPPDGNDQLFSVNAADRTIRAQNGYFDKYLYAPNMATHATSRYLSINVGGSSGKPNIQAAWDSLPDVCGEVRFRICGNAPGYAELKGKHVSFLIIESSDTSQMYDVGTIWMWGLNGRASYVTMSKNGTSSDDACRMYCCMFNFENVKFASAGRGLLLFNGSYAFLRYCSITGIGSVAKMAGHGLEVYSSSVNMYECSGVAGGNGIYMSYGSFAALKGNTFGPTHNTGGGVVVGSYTIDGTTYDAPTVSTSSTFSASTCVTWQSTYENNWKKLTSSVGTKVESRHSTTTSGFDYRAGWWVLDTGTAIKTALSGKTISKATVTIKRNDTNSDTRKCHLCYHSKTVTNTLNGNTDSTGGLYPITKFGEFTEIGSYNLNPSAETVITLPSSVYTKLQDGTIKGFGLIDNSTDYKQIMCDNTCVLNVVYS